MQISRWIKAVVYEALTALLLIAAVVVQTQFYTAAETVSVYIRVNLWMFLAAACLMGVGVYSYMSYSRRRAEHRMDSLFLLLTGLVLMGMVVFALVQYGGLAGHMTDSICTAVNITQVLLLALPVAFWVRSVVLAFSTREEKRGKRLGVQIASVLLAAAAIILLAAGRMMTLMEPEQVRTEQTDVYNGLDDAQEDIDISVES